MITTEEKFLAAFGHLSYLAALPVAVPLILYLWKKDTSPFVAEQAKQAVGIHVFSLLVTVIALVFVFCTFGLGAFLAVPILSLIGMLLVVFTVVAVLKIAEGRSYHYPLFGDWVDSL